MREPTALFGAAITGAILSARERAALAAGATQAAAFVDGYRAGLWVSVGAMVVGAAGTTALARAPEAA
jgi:hypothetical protein